MPSPPMADHAIGQHALVGQRFGHYRIAEKIGAGGMGEVYRARDEHLDREVAIKVLPPGTLADEQARKRFRKEALALSKLNHPNIATIHDFDTEQGVDFLVMEYIPGTTLADRLAPRALAEKDVVSLGVQLAEGLSAAHERGVVHRDLKPGNLRLTGDGRLKILDFGLAKLQLPAAESAATESRSATRVVAGTLPYMAPEQLLAGVIDARTDIHAAGAVLYEAATGKRPFAGVERSQLVGAILGKPPLPPTAVNPRLSLELERIISKCLEKEPENRYQSARELAIDLRRLQAGTTAGLRAIARPARWPAAKLAGLGAVVLATVVVLLLAFDSGGWRQHLLEGAAGQRFESLAVLPVKNYSGDPAQEFFADGMTDALIAGLSQIGSVKVVSRTSVMHYRGSSETLPKIARELGVDAIVEGSVVRSGSRVRLAATLVDARQDRPLWTKNYDRDMADVLALQSELVRAIVGEIGATLTPQEQRRLTSARTVNPDAYDAYLAGRVHWYKNTPQELGTALNYFQLALEKDPNLALALAGIGSVWWMRAHSGLVPSREGWPKAKEAAERALAIDPSLAEAHELLAVVLAWYEWDWAAGDREYRRAIELRPNNASTRCMYSFFLHAMRRQPEANREIERALELDPYNGFFHMAAGMQLINQGRADQALSVLRKAEALERDNPFVHANLHFALAMKGNHEQAGAEIRKYFVLAGLGELAKAMDLGCAKGGYMVGLRRAADAAAAASPRASLNPMEIGDLYAESGEVDRAVDWYEKAYQARSSQLPYLNVSLLPGPVRANPRFQALVRRMNFPSETGVRR